MENIHFTVFMATTWILFLALFPLTFFWFRRAYRIFFKNDYSEVALKKGEPPKNPKKWATPVGIINIVAGLVAVWTIFGVIVLALPYQTWSAIAGSTIWCKIFADWIIKGQAHPIQFGRKKKAEQK